MRFRTKEAGIWSKMRQKRSIFGHVLTCNRFKTHNLSLNSCKTNFYEEKPLKKSVCFMIFFKWRNDLEWNDFKLPT